jgi:hypothetical protein
MTSVSDFTVSIEDPARSGWDISKLVVSRPSKRTDHRTSKIRYDKEHRVVIEIPRAVIVRSSDSSSKGGMFAVYIRVPRTAHDFLFDLDEHMIQTTVTKRTAWFGEDVTDDFIRDLYSPCVVYDRKYGGLLRLYVEQGMEEDVERVREVRFVLRCLRFNKKSYHMAWQLASDLPPSDAVAWNADAGDEEEEELFSPPVVQPSAEDLKVIQGDILDRASAAEREVRDRGAKLAKLLDRVLSVRRDAAKDSAAQSLESLEAISSELDLISAELAIKQHTFCVA